MKIKSTRRINLFKLTIILLSLLAFPLFSQVENLSRQWSNYQGKMNWNNAKAHCKKIGMNLPTISELQMAYAKGITESWKEDDIYYWSSTPYGEDSASGFSVDISLVSSGGQVFTNGRNFKLSVRCIEGAEATSKLFEENPIRRWSSNQGKMNWKNAKAKCASLSMKLPSFDEFKTAYDAGITASWTKNGDGYWSEFGSDNFNSVDYYYAYDCHTATGRPYHLQYVRCVNIPEKLRSMNWSDAKAKCKSLGMRLPTINELKAAYITGETESWGKVYSDYWSSTSNGNDFAFSLDISAGSVFSNSFSTGRNFRCIKGKEISQKEPDKKTSIVEAKQEPDKKSSEKQTKEGEVSEKTYDKLSEYQGNMIWENAKTKCSNLGLRLPTGKELEAAHLAKVTESWKSYGNVYWTSEEFSEDGAYGFDLSSESIGSYGKSYERHVRCIR